MQFVERESKTDLFSNGKETQNHSSRNTSGTSSIVLFQVTDDHVSESTKTLTPTVEMSTLNNSQDIEDSTRMMQSKT